MTRDLLPRLVILYIYKTSLCLNILFIFIILFNMKFDNYKTSLSFEKDEILLLTLFLW
jgi:hypothetical protein